MKREFNNKRILGIDPCPRGFGFALIDAPSFLVDWGVVGVPDKTATAYLVRIIALIARYSPDIVALPHPVDHHRRPLIRELASAAIRATTKRPITVRLVSKAEVSKAFPAARLKYDRALDLADAFPELHESLPPPRKAWISEDTRMNIFDALCLICATPEGTTQES